MIDAMRRALTRVGVLTAHPATFGVLLLFEPHGLSYELQFPLSVIQAQQSPPPSTLAS